MFSLVWVVNHLVAALLVHFDEALVKHMLDVVLDLAGLVQLLLHFYHLKLHLMHLSQLSLNLCLLRLYCLLVGLDLRLRSPPDAALFHQLSPDASQN